MDSRPRRGRDLSGEGDSPFAREWAVGDVQTQQSFADTSTGVELHREAGWRSARATHARPPLGRGLLRQIVHDAGGFIPDAAGKVKGVKVVRVAPHQPNAALGMVASVELKADERRIPGLLALKLPSPEDAEVDLTTVRVFRWRAEIERYELIENSGQDGGCAWAIVASVGHYVAAGLPREPAKRTFFEALAALDETLARLDIEAQLTRRVELYSAATGSAPDATTQGLRPSPLEVSIALGAANAQTWNARQPWESLGPDTISGQIVDLAICPGPEEAVLYAACAGGGLWRASEFRPGDDWTGWEPLAEQSEYWWPLAIGVQATRPSTVYVAHGTGSLIRSDDGGVNWRSVTARTFGTVHRIIVHPDDVETVLVASQTGLWLSRNGGRDWGVPPLLAGDITDAVMDSVDRRVIYAAIRHLGVYKTRDFGGFWRMVLRWSTATNPTSTMTRLGIGQQGDPSTRTVVAKLAQQVFVHQRSADPPYAWAPMGILGRTDGASDGQGDQNHVLAVDPFDDKRFLAGQQDLELTTDRGLHWNWVGGYEHAVHPDQHRVVFDPVQPGRVYVATDGGVWVSTDGGDTWQDRNAGFVTTSMYQVGISGESAVAGTYHWGMLATHAFSQGWEPIEGGGWEFSRQTGDPSIRGRFYVLGATLRAYEYRAGEPKRLNLGYASFGALQVLPDWRFGSDALLVATPDGRLMRTLNRSSDTPPWTQEQGIQLSAAQHDIIVSLAMAPRPLDASIRSVPGWAYAVSATGRLFKKDELLGDAPWRQVGQWNTTIGYPADFRRTLGNRLAVNAIDPERIYLLSSQSFARSPDGGVTWTVANGTGRASLSGTDLRSVCAHPSDGRTLYVSSNGNVYLSRDEGYSWISVRDNMPVVEVNFLEAHSPWLYASTYGRGLWRRRI